MARRLFVTEDVVIVGGVPGKAALFERQAARMHGDPTAGGCRGAHAG